MLRAILGIVVAVLVGCFSTLDASATERALCDENDLNYEPREGFEPIQNLHRQAPEYPQSLARRGVEGWVVLQFNVGADGRPENIEITESVPTGAFDGIGRRALQQWQYQPHTVDGIPTICEGLKANFDFSLPWGTGR